MQSYERDYLPEKYEIVNKDYRQSKGVELDRNAFMQSELTRMA